MRQGVVLEGGEREDLSLDVVVGGEIAQVDEGGALHVGPTPPPQPEDASFGHDLAQGVQGPAHPGGLPLEAASTLHLDLSLH